MRTLSLILLMVLAADSGGTRSKEDPEHGNLLEFALGASVLSRTAELTLDHSALRVIDGDPESAWNSPQDDLHQTLVLALPGRTRVESVGIQTSLAPLFRVETLQIDGSVDGSDFFLLTRLELAASDQVQVFPVSPRELRYLRVTVLEAKGRFARLKSVQVRGNVLQAPSQQPIEGCWSINGFASRFWDERGRITGVLGSERPVVFEGGSDGRVYRFAWTSGPDWGFGAISTVPDGQHLSGLRWYVEPIRFSAAESWFGQRTACGGKEAAPPGGQAVTGVREQFLRRAGRFPLYGLHFDGQGRLDEARSAGTLDLLAALAREKRYRLVSRQFQAGSDAQDRASAQQRLQLLRQALQRRGVDLSRFDWQAIGNASPPRAIETEIQRVLYSVIELQPL